VPMKRLIFLLIFIGTFFSAIAQVVKPLDVQAGFPHFLRNGDKIEIPVTFRNRSTTEISGSVQLQFFDPVKKTSIDGWLNNFFPFQYFNVDNTKSTEILFPITIPANYDKAVVDWKLVVNKDTIQQGKLNVVDVINPTHTLKNIQLKKQVFLLHGNKKIALKNDANIFVGDTLLVEVNIKTTAKLKALTFFDAIPANTKCIDEERYMTPGFAWYYFEALNVGNKNLNYKLIVAHAGTASLPVSKITSGNMKATFSNNLLIRTANR
jgi:hypothetical protein